MQTSLMFLDLPSQELLPDINKIAVKMPKGQGELENGAYGGFADIINALMSGVPAEELQQSLDQLEWVPVEEGDLSEFAPLIDLTQGQAKAIGMARRLLNEAAPETLRQAETLKSVLFPTGSASLSEGGDVQPEDGLKLPVQTVGGHQNHPGMDLPETADQQMQQRLRSAVEARISDANGAQNSSDQAVGAMKTEPTASKKSGADVTAKMAEAVLDNERAAVMPPAEGAEHEGRTETMEKRFSQMTPIQASKGQADGEGETGQKFTGGQQQDSDQLEKQNAKSVKGEDARTRDFKPGIVDHMTDSVHETSDPVNKSIPESREMHASMAKMKQAGGESSPGVSSGREAGPHTTSQEMQTNVIRQIVQRMTLHTQGTQSTMTIRLKPEFLGQVQMQISTDHHQVIVRMATESMAVKEMVEQGLQHLKSELQQHGLEIDKFDVFVANDNEENKQGQEWDGFRQALKRRQRSAMNRGGKGSVAGRAPASEEVGNRRKNNGAGEIDYFA